MGNSKISQTNSHTPQLQPTIITHTNVINQNTRGWGEECTNEGRRAHVEGAPHKSSRAHTRAPQHIQESQSTYKSPRAHTRRLWQTWQVMTTSIRKTIRTPHLGHMILKDFYICRRREGCVDQKLEEYKAKGSGSHYKTIVMLQWCLFFINLEYSSKSTVGRFHVSKLPLRNCIVFLLAFGWAGREAFKAK
jgi:hypothetical protein